MTDVGTLGVPVEAHIQEAQAAAIAAEAEGLVYFYLWTTYINIYQAEQMDAIISSIPKTRLCTVSPGMNLPSY